MDLNQDTIHQEGGTSSFSKWRGRHGSDSDHSDDGKTLTPSDEDVSNVLGSQQPVRTVEVASGAGTDGEQGEPVLVTGQGGVQDNQIIRPTTSTGWYAVRLTSEIQSLLSKLNQVLTADHPPGLHEREGARKRLEDAVANLHRPYWELDPVKIREAGMSLKKPLKEVFEDCDLDDEVRKLEDEMLSIINIIVETCHLSIGHSIKLLCDMIKFDPCFSSFDWQGSGVYNDINTHSGCVLKCFGHMVSYLYKTGPLQLHVQVSALVASLLGKTRDEVTLHYCNHLIGSCNFQELIQQGLLHGLRWFLIKGEEDFALALKNAFDTLIRSNFGGIFMLALEKQAGIGHCVVCLPIGKVILVGCDVGEFVDVSRMYVYVFPSNVRDILNNRIVPAQLSLTFN